MKKKIYNLKYIWLCISYISLELYIFLFNRIPLVCPKTLIQGKLHIYYRISDFSFNKARPEYITNFNCLNNFLKHFEKNQITIIADNVLDSTYNKLIEMNLNVIRTDYKNGADSFNHALSLALKLPDTDYVYFVEDDYIHRDRSNKILMEGLKTGADYVTLYDDKNIYRKEKPNKLLKNKSKLTRIIVSKSTHWATVLSTTMTFASQVATLKKDEKILRKFTCYKYPYDFHMFLALRKKGRSLISPIPSYSTHGHCKELAHLYRWGKEL